jgi:hypothetical protein
MQAKPRTPGGVGRCRGVESSYLWMADAFPRTQHDRMREGVGESFQRGRKKPEKYDDL